MYDKDLYNKILSVSCSFEELENFVIDINKKEFDLDNAFEKYYDVEKILYAIRRYERGEVEDKYLAYWMNAYNWIIMAGFKLKKEETEITFQEFLEDLITDWLDSLSFFDDSDDWYNLDDYKNTYIALDKVYKNINDWEHIFAHTDEFGDNDDDVVVLAYNNKTKEFVKLYHELDYLNYKVNIERVELDRLKKEIRQLKKRGFEEMKYGTFHEFEE
ncbi:MAG: hypothetical protein SPH07_06205 [Eubacteriales bacterium]|nr:hypothetical protein [Eubacteriales bacterium]